MVRRLAEAARTWLGDSLTWPAALRFAQASPSPPCGSWRRGGTRRPTPHCAAHQSAAPATPREGQTSPSRGTHARVTCGSA
eukprot:933368-Prorocentrum_minimum.AAC.1